MRKINFGMKFVYFLTINYTYKTNKQNHSIQ